jgi:hypothetical protein
MNTDTKAPKPGKALKSGRLLLAIAAFAVFNSLVAAAYWQSRELEALRTVGKLRFAGENEEKKAEPFDGAERKLARRLAAEYPYRQELLYFLFRDADARKDVKQADFFATQMARLGWRNTSVQRSLLIRAAKDRRYDELLDRADAMLRRDVLADQALQLVFLFELNAQVRQPLVKALMNMPTWRGEFFAQAGILNNPASRLARFDTISHLLDARATLRRDEVAPLVNALDRAGDVRRAENIWVRFAKPGPKTADFDPSFQRLAKLDPDRPDLTMPFEWQLGQGTGHNSYLESTGGVRIEWDGRGVPVFMKRRLRLNSARPVRVSISFGTDIMAASAAIDVALVCNASRVTTPLDKKEMAADRDAVIFTGAAPACDLPELVISGGLRDEASPADFSVRSVNVSAI